MTVGKAIYFQGPQCSRRLSVSEKRERNNRDVFSVYSFVFGYDNVPRIFIHGPKCV